MTEAWLQSNRRALGLALVSATLVAVLGGGLLVGSEGAMDIVGWALVGAGLLLIAGLLRQLTRPRIAYRDGHVLFNLRAGAPIAVPREVVEAFFLGQGPAYLPRVHGAEAETLNLVARLSQKAPEWMQVAVKPALGYWCEGYVTIRGTWCEPLTGEVIRRLNARLRELRMADQAGTCEHARQHDSLLLQQASTTPPAREAEA